MRIIAISDTHTARPPLPKGDILIHCGDALGRGRISELEEFNEWLGEQSFRKIIYVAGNHDLIFETQTGRARSILTNAHYLQDETYEWEGIRFYGSPWTLPFRDWAFMADEKRLKEIYAGVPEKLDFLITHGPPSGILDKVDSISVGSTSLLELVHRIRPRRHLFGHIHGSYGHETKMGVDFYNCCSMSEDYEPINKPFIIDFP